MIDKTLPNILFPRFPGTWLIYVFFLSRLTGELKARKTKLCPSCTIKGFLHQVPARNISENKTLAIRMV
jgi:hypothetical protein